MGFKPVRWLRNMTTSSSFAGWLAEQRAELWDWFGPTVRTVRKALVGADFVRIFTGMMASLVLIQGFIAALPVGLAPAWLTTNLGLAISIGTTIADAIRRYYQGPAVSIFNGTADDGTKTMTIVPPVDRTIVVTQPTGQEAPAGEPVIVHPAPDQPAIVIPAAEPVEGFQAND